MNNKRRPLLYDSRKEDELHTCRQMTSMRTNETDDTERPTNKSGFLLGNLFDRHDAPSDDSDTLLATELNRLTLKEREQVLYDVHGISDVVAESPLLVAEKLEELDKLIATIRPKKAYEKAKTMDPKYVRSRTLRLPFLRAERFDAARAANRMIQFFEAKQKLFGNDKLASDIRLRDLDEDNKKCLRSGLCQILPLRDTAGRTIVCWIPMARGDSSILNRVS